MDRKLYGLFSGTHLTAIACAAILAPSALLAAVSYSSVAIVNTSTGTAASVDASGDLHTTDHWTQYRNDPRNAVTIRVPNGTGAGCSTATYTMPTGKALIITAVGGDFYNASGSAISGFWIYGGATCSGNQYITQYVPVVATAGSVAQKSFEYGNGVPVPAGSLSVYADNDSGWTVIEGFLVPQALVLPGSYQYASKTTSGVVPAAARPGPSSR